MYTTHVFQRQSDVCGFSLMVVVSVCLCECVWVATAVAYMVTYWPIRSLDIRDRNRSSDVLLHLLSAAVAEYQCLHRDRLLFSFSGQARRTIPPTDSVPCRRHQPPESSMHYIHSVR